MSFVLRSLATMLLVSNARHVEEVRDGERKSDDDHLRIRALLHHRQREHVLNLAIALPCEKKIFKNKTLKMSLKIPVFQTTLSKREREGGRESEMKFGRQD